MKKGDVVIRNMFGIRMELYVTDVTNDRIICGDWEFDKKTGAEIDDMLSGSPSFLEGVKNANG